MTWSKVALIGLESPSEATLSKIANAFGIVPSNLLVSGAETPVIDLVRSLMDGRTKAEQRDASDIFIILTEAVPPEHVSKYNKLTKINVNISQDFEVVDLDSLSESQLSHWFSKGELLVEEAPVAEQEDELDFLNDLLGDDEDDESDLIDQSQSSVHHLAIVKQEDDSEPEPPRVVERTDLPPMPGQKSRVQQPEPEPVIARRDPEPEPETRYEDVQEVAQHDNRGDLPPMPTMSRPRTTSPVREPERVPEYVEPVQQVVEAPVYSAPRPEPQTEVIPVYRDDMPPMPSRSDRQVETTVQPDSVYQEPVRQPDPYYPPQDDGFTNPYESNPEPEPRAYSDYDMTQHPVEAPRSAAINPEEFSRRADPEPTMEQRNAEYDNHYARTSYSEDPSMDNDWGVQDYDEQNDPPYMRHLSPEQRIEQRNTEYERKSLGFARHDAIGREKSVITYVTGSHGGAGKTTLAWILAATYAYAQQTKDPSMRVPVTLIEVDYKNPKLQQRLDIPKRKSLGAIYEQLHRYQKQNGDRTIHPEQLLKIIDMNTEVQEDSGLRVITCPYDLRGINPKSMQWAIVKAIKAASHDGGAIFLDGGTMTSNELDPFDTLLANKVSNHTVVVSDSGHISDFQRTCQLLTDPKNEYRKSHHNIHIFLNNSTQEQMEEVQQEVAPYRVDGRFPVIPEIGSGNANRSVGQDAWVRNASADTFRNMVFFSARFLSNIGFDDLESLIPSQQAAAPAGLWSRLARTFGNR